MPKIVIRFRPIADADFDFGLISNDLSKGNLKVDKEWWGKYVEARYNFEILHKELVRKLPKKWQEDPSMKKALDSR